MTRHFLSRLSSLLDYYHHYFPASTSDWCLVFTGIYILIVPYWWYIVSKKRLSLAVDNYHHYHYQSIIMCRRGFCLKRVCDVSCISLVQIAFAKIAHVILSMHICDDYRRDPNSCIYYPVNLVFCLHIDIPVCVSSDYDGDYFFLVGVLKYLFFVGKSVKIYYRWCSRFHCIILDVGFYNAMTDMKGFPSAPTLEMRYGFPCPCI